MRAADYCADFLRARGVRRAFGIPGSEAIELLEAMRQRGIEYVLVHHEATAAFMAAATAQLTGVPGVCIVTRGPGAMNLYPGVATAYLDRRAVVAISADHAPEDPPRDTHQRLPLVEQFAHVTKWSGRLAAETLAADLEESWRLAQAGRPGPIYWAFPAAEVEREMPEGTPPPRPLGEGGAWDPIAPATGGVDAGLRAALDHQLRARLARAAGAEQTRAAAERVQAARRPIVVAGIGAAREGVLPELLGLVETLGCPVLTTPQAKGWFPEEHPYFAGTFGMYRDEPLHVLIEEADLVLAVGLDGVDFFKRWRASAPVVSLADGEADDSTFRPALAVDGDLAVLVAGVAAAARPGDWPIDRARQAREAVAEIVRPRGASAPDGDGMRMPPQTAIEELRRALPANGILTVDVGSHKIVVVQQWRAPGPNTFICSNGLSPMGTGLPFAIAAALERPETPVACALGDGGFLMYAGELETVARLGLPIVMLLLVDGAMSSIKVKQDRRGYEPVGTAFGQPDYGLVARGFGIAHARVADRASCRAALERAFARREATLVEALIDPAEYDGTQ